MNNTKDLALERKYRQQRMMKGYCDEDLFEVDTWFLTIMPKMISELRKTSHWMSNVIIDDFCKVHKEELMKRIPDKGYITQELINKDEWKILEKKWEDTLVEMETCFLNAVPKTCSYKNKYQQEYDEAWQKFRKKHKSDRKKPNIPLIDFDGFDKENKGLHEKWFSEEKKIDKFMLKNKKRAIQMFVKYLDDLGF